MRADKPVYKHVATDRNSIIGLSQFVAWKHDKTGPELFETCGPNQKIRENLVNMIRHDNVKQQYNIHVPPSFIINTIITYFVIG